MDHTPAYTAKKLDTWENPKPIGLALTHNPTFWDLGLNDVKLLYFYLHLQKNRFSPFLLCFFGLSYEIISSIIIIASILLIIFYR